VEGVIGILIVAGVAFVIWRLLGRAHEAAENAATSGVERARARRIAAGSRSEIAFSVSTRADVKNLLLSRFQNVRAHTFETNFGPEFWNYYTLDRDDTIYVGAGPRDGILSLGFIYGVTLHLTGVGATGLAVLTSIDPALAQPSQELLPLFKETLKGVLASVDQELEWSESRVGADREYRPEAQEIIDAAPNAGRFRELREGFSER
jgi:hypothetical protein